MNKIFLAPMLIVMMLFAQTQAHAQDSSSTKHTGLSAQVQGSQIDILIPIVSKHLSLAPSIGFVWGQDAGTEIRLGLVPRVYISRDKVSPYIGARVVYLFSKPTGMTGSSDWLIGAEFGGEYFVDQWFSLGIESQLNVAISAENSARFGNPGKTSVNTGVAMFATVYF